MICALGKDDDLVDEASHLPAVETGFETGHLRSRQSWQADAGDDAAGVPRARHGWARNDSLPDTGQCKFLRMNSISSMDVDCPHVECPRCRGAMDLVRTRKTIAGGDLHVFACEGCEYAQVMSRDPHTAAMTWILSGARPAR